MRTRTDNFHKAAEELGINTDFDLALALDLHPSTLSKLFTRKAQASEVVIVRALDLFRERKFEDLFEIVDEAA